MKSIVIIITALLAGCGSMRQLSDAEYQQAMQMLQRFERRPAPVAPVVDVRCTWQRIGNTWYQSCF